MPTTAFCLTFNSKTLPEKIQIGYLKKKVTTYVPPVRRCQNCQGFGHLKEQCRYKIKCVRCGGEHATEKCEHKDEPICFRCSGQHSAAYEGCPMYKKAKQIQSTQFKEKISYSDAVKKVNSVNIQVTNAPQTKQKPNYSEIVKNNPSKIPRPSKNNTPVHQTSANLHIQTGPQRPVPPPPKIIPVNQPTTTNNPNSAAPTPTTNPNTAAPTPTKEPEQTKPQSFQFNDLIAFLAFILNNLDAHHTKSNRIKLVVDAARHCFGYTAEAEAIHAKLMAET